MRKKERFLIDGTSFYHGKPCPDCGETVRYGSSGNCRRCNLEQIEQYKIRVELSKMGDSPVEPPKPEGVFKESEPCRHCGDTRRYTKSGACPTCKTIKQRAYRERKREVNPTKHQIVENPPKRRKSALFSMFKRLFCFPLNFYRSCVNL